MADYLPKSEEETIDDSVSIGEAASLLNVSIDTLRRWNKDGKIVSSRPDGKNRFFRLSDLENLKYSQGLPISEASKVLGISPTTLRRLEDRYILVPKRDENGERVYHRKDIENFLKSSYFLHKKYVEEKMLESFEKENEPGKDEHQVKIKILGAIVEENRSKLHKLLSFRKKIVLFTFLLIMICLVIITSITYLFIVYPLETSKFLRLNNQILNTNSIDNQNFGKVLGATTIKRDPLNDFIRSSLVPFSQASLIIVKKINPKTYEDIAPYNLDDFFSIDSNENLVPESKIILSNDKIAVLGDSVIKNLNASFLLGKIPGQNEGNLAVFAENGEIEGFNLTVGSANFTGLLQLSQGGTNSDLSESGTGGIAYKNSNGLAVTGVLNGILKANGTSAPTSITGSDGYLARWTTSGVSLGDATIYDSTTDIFLGAKTKALAKIAFINLTSGTPAIQINGTSVLEPTTLGSGVVNSSLTSLGTLTSLNVSGNATISGAFTVSGTLTTSSELIVSARGTFTKVPTQAHTGAWNVDSSTWNVSDASVYINPASATGDSNILGAAVNGNVKFAIDAEGDIFGRNLVLTGSTTQGTTNVAGDLVVEGNTTLGDNTSDTVSINPATLTFAGGNKSLDITGAATRTLTILNSTSSQVADLDLSDGSLFTGGTSRLTNVGALQNITGYSQSSGNFAISGTGTFSTGTGAISLNGNTTADGEVNLTTGNTFQINGTNVLSATTLGSAVVSSSLTSVGTITSGTWQANTVAILYGGTGAATASDARTNLGLAIGTNVQAYDATLAALASYNTNGILVQTAADTFAGRTIAGTTGKITVSDGDGVLGNPTITIATDYLGQTSITTLGTIGTGVWNGTALIDAYISDTLTASIFKGSGTLTDALDLATAEVSGVLPIANGGTNTLSLGSAGTIAYSNGSAYAFNAVGNSGECLKSAGAGTPAWQSCDASFSSITSGTNTTAAMVVGTGASLNFTASGTINASTLLGSTWAAPGTIGSTTPNSAAFTTLTTTSTASISGNLTLAGGLRSIQTTANNTLTIGGNTTGNITLSPLDSGSGAKVIPGADNLVSLGSSPSARFKDIFLGSGSVHIQCTTGDGCGQGLDYALGVNTSTGTFSIGVNGTSAVGNPLLNITQGGNVGIRNTNPGALLDVGSAGSTLGVIRLEGNTSGYAAIQPTAAAGNVTITLPANTGTVAVAATSTTATQALFATATAGAPAYRAIADADIPDNITISLAATATALAADPADCSGNNFALGINASGTAQCAQPAFSNLSGSATDAQIPNNITIDLATLATLANGVNQYPNRTDAAWYQINWNNAAAGDKNLYSSANILLRSSGYGAVGWNGSAWYIEGNATYGLYSNTGLYAAGGLWDAGNRVCSASAYGGCATHRGEGTNYIDYSAYQLINGATWAGSFNWSGQGGQPTWLWGSNDGANMYVWNPSNFSVNYSNSTYGGGNFSDWPNYSDTTGNANACSNDGWCDISQLGATSEVYFTGIPNASFNTYICRNATGRVGYASGGCTGSSLRIKHDIESLNYGLEDILKLKPVSFIFNDDPTAGGTRTERRIGFIAEEMNTVIPEVVTRDNEGLIQSIDYPTLTALNTRGIQQMYTKIASMEADLSISNSGNLNILEQEASGSAEFAVTDGNGKTYTRISAFSEAIVGSIRAGIITVKKLNAETISAGVAQFNNLATDSLSVATDSVTIAGQTLRDYIAENSGGGLASQGETLQGEALQNQIAELRDQVASISAVLGTATASDAASQSAELNNLAQAIKEKQLDIAILEATSSAQASSVTADTLDRLRVTGSILVEGVLTVLDNMIAQNLIVNSLSTFFGEAVFKDIVKFEDHIALGKDSVGQLTIEKGQSGKEVKFIKQYDSIPVINATLKISDSSVEDKILSSGYTFAVTKATESGFTIKLNKNAEENLTFSWSAF